MELDLLQRLDSIKMCVCVAVEVAGMATGERGCEVRSVIRSKCTLVPQRHTHITPPQSALLKQIKEALAAF